MLTKKTLIPLIIAILGVILMFSTSMENQCTPIERLFSSPCWRPLSIGFSMIVAGLWFVYKYSKQKGGA